MFGKATAHTNVSTGKIYLGENQFKLAEYARANPKCSFYWGTIKQWAEFGLEVKEGERGVNLRTIFSSTEFPIKVGVNSWEVFNYSQTQISKTPFKSGYPISLRY